MNRHDGLREYFEITNFFAIDRVLFLKYWYIKNHNIV